MALISVADALARVLDGVAALESEKVALTDAAGRVLAVDLKAKRSQPPFAASAMDGYAARADDLALDKPLAVIGDAAAGHPLDKEVGPGQAARIFTGAVVPRGADTVVEQEAATRTGNEVRLTTRALGKHIRAAGVDFREGETLLAKGRRLTARDIGLAAAMDHAAIEVARRPRLAIFSTGDELVTPGAGGAPDRIVASNPYSVGALAAHHGAEITRIDILKDRVETIAEAISGASADGTDIVVTLGGASVGDHDLIRPALERAGASIDFHRVALRPGKPTLYGRAGATRLIGLPGNPVSAYICAIIFLVPLLRKLQGCADASIARVPAVLGANLWENDEREDYLRASCSRDAQGRLIATPFERARQDSSLTTMLARADCLVIRAPNARPARAGDTCEIIFLDD